MKVWVNGTFDVLHLGHIKLLNFASTIGKVMVGIDSDRRVKELKGEDRPFNNQNDRMEFLLSLKSVNDVVIFDTDEELIEKIKLWDPNFMIIGEEYRDKKIIGEDFMKDKILFFNTIDGYSTTKILNSK